MSCCRLDGRKEIHDRLRRTPSGQGSYDRIVPKFQRAGRQPRPAGTITCGGLLPITTPDFVEDVLHMAGSGIHPAFAWSRWSARPGDPYALTEDDLPIAQAAV